jgi:hypothetical protein
MICPTFKLLCLYNQDGLVPWWWRPSTKVPRARRKLRAEQFDFDQYKGAARAHLFFSACSTSSSDDEALLAEEHGFSPDAMAPGPYPVPFILSLHQDWCQKIYKKDPNLF